MHAHIHTRTHTHTHTNTHTHTPTHLPARKSPLPRTRAVRARRQAAPLDAALSTHCSPTRPNDIYIYNDDHEKKIVVPPQILQCRHIVILQRDLMIYTHNDDASRK